MTYRSHIIDVSFVYVARRHNVSFTCVWPNPKNHWQKIHFTPVNDLSYTYYLYFICICGAQTQSWQQVWEYVTHVWVIHVTYVNELWCTYYLCLICTCGAQTQCWQRVRIYDTHVNDTCHVCEYMSRMWMSHETYMEYKCHVFEYHPHTHVWQQVWEYVTHIWMIHVTYVNESVTYMEDSYHVFEYRVA